MAAYRPAAWHSSFLFKSTDNASLRRALARFFTSNLAPWLTHEASGPEGQWVQAHDGKSPSHSRQRWRGKDASARAHVGQGACDAHRPAGAWQAKPRRRRHGEEALQHVASSTRSISKSCLKFGGLSGRAGGCWRRAPPRNRRHERTVESQMQMRKISNRSGHLAVHRALHGFGAINSMSNSCLAGAAPGASHRTGAPHACGTLKGRTAVVGGYPHGQGVQRSCRQRFLSGVRGGSPARKKRF